MAAAGHTFPVDYAAKRSFDQTPEPEPAVAGDVDPVAAPAGGTFVIHQHHARRLHFDLRLEMMNGEVPVLVSWAVPKNLPVKRGGRALAVHVEDHPFEYGSFSGSIPAGNYGAGEVRIFDSGEYEMVKREPGKLTFRLMGRRLKGVWHLIKTGSDRDKENWLVILSQWEGAEPEPLPPSVPMIARPAEAPLKDASWAYEPEWRGSRALAICKTETRLFADQDREIPAPDSKLAKLHERIVALDAMVDGVIVTAQTPSMYVAFDLLYLDGRCLTGLPYRERRRLLEECVVPAEFVEPSPSMVGEGAALLEAVRNQGLEGVIAKEVSSLYEPGVRSDSWRRIQA